MKGSIISKKLTELSIEPKEDLLVAFGSKDDWYVGFITNTDYKPLIEKEFRWVFVEGPNINAPYKLSDLYTFKVVQEDNMYCLDYDYWMYAVTKNIIDNDTEVHIRNPINNIVILDVVTEAVCIESQAVNNETEAKQLCSIIKSGFLEGCTVVYDYWGHNAYDKYGIIDSIKKFFSFSSKTETNN
jgi:hypothetical protein